MGGLERLADVRPIIGRNVEEGDDGRTRDWKLEDESAVAELTRGHVEVGTGKVRHIAARGNDEGLDALLLGIGRDDSLERMSRMGNVSCGVDARVSTSQKRLSGGGGSVWRTNLAVEGLNARDFSARDLGHVLEGRPDEQSDVGLLDGFDDALAVCDLLVERRG